MSSRSLADFEAQTLMPCVKRAQNKLARLVPICIKRALFIFGALSFFAEVISACSCFLDPACAYVGQSDIIFVGKVNFSNDDGTGTFAQASLIRFEVEEALKGLSPDVHEVWIDPGSFTSCYADYPRGKRYLVFASSRVNFSNVVAMTVVNSPPGRKAPPPGFDPQNPPRVYLANECSGTREINAETGGFISGDLAFLRAWKEGNATTRIYGRVLDDVQFHAWPASDPPALQGATLTLRGETQKWTAISDSKGAYWFDRIPPGQYSLDATIDGYRAYPPSANFALTSGTCGYAEFNMVTDGALEGVVRDHFGRHRAGIELVVQRLLPGGGTDFIGYTNTDKNGIFRFSDLPTGDFHLGVNIDRGPDVREPFPRSYFPGTSQPTSIHLGFHEHRKGLTLTLPPPLKTRIVRVHVTWADSTPVAEADVEAFLMKGGFGESTKTDGSGNAKLACLADTPYRVAAKKWLPGHGSVSHIAAQSEPSSLPVEPWRGVIRLVLIKASKPF